jgi:O-antigen/teichoic acid export membrane protein
MSSSPDMLARLRRLAANSGIYLTGDAVAQGFALLLFPLYTRYLSPSEFGILAVAQAVTIVLTIVLGVALSGAITRLHFEAENEEERRRLYGTVLAFMLAVPAVAAGVLHVLGKLGALDLFDTAPYTPYLQYAVGTAYLSIFLQVPVAIYQARQEASKVMALTILNALGLAGATITFVVVLDEGAIGALRGMLIAAGITALVSVVLTARMSALPLSRRWLTRAFDYSLPLVPHLLGTWVLYLSDRLVLERFVSAADLGLYSLGASIGTAAHFLVTAAGRAFSPAITLALKDAEERNQVPLLGTYWLLGIAWACCALALLLTDAIRLLAPDEFHEATEVVGWIVFGYLAFGVYNIAAQGTYFSMRTRIVPVITLAAGTLNVGLNFALVPPLGIVGSAVATLIAFAALAVMQGALSQRLYPIAWEYGRWAKILVAALVAFAVGSLGGDDTTALSIALKLAAIAAAFPLALTVAGFWQPAERAFLRSLPTRLRRA